MSINETREIFKENEFCRYTVFPKERKIVFVFDNNHTISIEVKGHPGAHYEWDESVVAKIDGNLVASM